MKVALVFHFLSHYRFPIYNMLCQQNAPDSEYVIFADSTGRDQIKTIDFALSQTPPNEGGLVWKKLHNIWLGRTFLWQSGVINVVLDKNFECIIFLGSMYHFSTWIGAILARITGKRVLMWTHGYLREERTFKGWLREKFYRLAHGLLLYGDRSRQFLLKRGLDPDRLYVVYNSLDYDEQRRVREMTTLEALQKLKEELFSSPGLPVLIFAGRLTHQKKLLQLLQAVHLLKEAGVLINVLLVGDGPEKAILEQAALRYGISDYVIFYGSSYSEEEVGPLMMLASICVAPGEIGLTCMHAFAYGTPVITHDNQDQQMPEWEAVQPGITGNFFIQGNVQDLARVIKEWLDRDLSRNQVSENCRKVINSHYNPYYQIKIINAAVSGIPATEMPTPRQLTDGN